MRTRKKDSEGFTLTTVLAEFVVAVLVVALCALSASAGAPIVQP